MTDRLDPDSDLRFVSSLPLENSFIDEVITETATPVLLPFVTLRKYQKPYGLGSEARSKIALR